MKTSIALASAVSTLLSGSASATVIYNYTGLPFTTFQVFGTPPVRYSPSDSVTGFVELTSALPANQGLTTVSPLAFSFSDGIGDTISSATPSYEIDAFEFSTVNGIIASWFIEVNAPAGSAIGPGTHLLDISTDGGVPAQSIGDLASEALCAPNSVPNDCIVGTATHVPIPDAYSQQGFNSTPGQWSGPDPVNPVPEPSTLALFGAGLVCLGAMRRHRNANKTSV